MPLPGEHSARLLDPKKLKPYIRVRRTQGSGDGRVQGVEVPASIGVIWYIIRGKDGGEVPRAQALRFPIKAWTATKAKAWLKTNKIRYIRFEAAAPRKQAEPQFREVPTAAFYCREPMDLRLADMPEGGGGPRFEMIAHSGQRVKSPYLGDMVIDLASLEVPRQEIPVLREHERDRIAGQTDAIEVGTQIKCRVVIFETPSGSEVVELDQQGFRWEASIYFPGGRLREVSEKQVVSVNGREEVGPLTIVEGATLREVSFCTLGADAQTSATILGDGGEELVQVEVISTPSEGDAKMAEEETVDVVQEPELKTVDALAEAYPELVAELRVQAGEEARTAERERIAGIRGLALTGQGELVEELIAGGVSVEEAAVKLMEAAKATGIDKLAQLQQAQAPEVGPGNEPPVKSAEEPPITAQGEEAVKACAEERKLTAAQAALAVAGEQPDLYEAYLAELNK